MHGIWFDETRCRSRMDGWMDVWSRFTYSFIEKTGTQYSISDDVRVPVCWETPFSSSSIASRQGLMSSI